MRPERGHLDSSRSKRPAFLFVPDWSEVDFDPEILKSLRDQVEAQLRTEAEIKRQADETTRLRRSEQAKVAMLTDIVERYANLGEQVAGLVRVTMGQQVSLSGVVESLDEIRLQLEEVKRLTLLLVGALAPKRDIQKFLERADEVSREMSLKRQIISNRRNLQAWEEKAALYGPLDAPVSLVHQIEEARLEIERLEQELGR